jgi:queuosine precursor transporter
VARFYKVSSETFYVILAVLFVSALILADLIGGTLIQIGPFSASMGGQHWHVDVIKYSAGIIPFPVTFLLTDMINEFYGPKGARKVTFIGLLAALFVFSALAVIRMVPIAPDSPISATAFHQVFGMSQRIFIASLTAYVIGQMLDIFVFFALRKLTKGKHLWLRATGSTVFSQLIDSGVVTMIAFYDTLPWAEILHIGLNNYSVKFAAAILLTPLCYLSHSLIHALLDKRIDDSHHLIRNV